LTREAEQDFNTLTPEQRRAIIRLIALIQRNPAVDNLSKFLLRGGGVENGIARDDVGHWALYYVAGNEVRVVSVGFGGLDDLPEPSL